MPNAYIDSADATKGLTEAFVPINNAQTAAIQNAASLVPNNVATIQAGQAGGVSSLSSTEGAKTVQDIKNATTPPPPPTDPKTGQPIVPPPVNPVDTLTAQTIQKELDAGKTQAEKDADTSTVLWNSTVPQQDLTGQKTRQIESIRNTYAAARTLLNESNARLEKTVQTAGIRSGTARYSPEIAAGIMASEERASAGRIAELNAKEQSAIAGIEQAFSDKEYTLGVQKYEVLQGIQKEKTQAIQDAQTKASEQLKKLQEQNRIVDIDTNISDLISSGFTDPNKIAQELKKRGISATAKDIGDALKNLTVSGSGDEDDLKTDWDMYSYHKKNGTLPENIKKLPESEQYPAWVNLMGLAKRGDLNKAAEASGRTGEGVNPGVGAKNGLEEQMIRDRMFITFTPLFNKGILSNEDRAVIEEKVAFYRNNGITEGQMLSIFAGMPFDIDSPIKNTLAAIITATTKNADTHRELISKTAILLKNGDEASAVRIIENQAIARALEQKVINPETFVTEDDVIYIRDKVEDINDLLGEGWADEVGAFTGSFSNWLSSKFGVGQAISIRAKLSSLTAGMLKKRVGSAITETEWERAIKPNIPQMNESPRAWADKMDELVSDAVERYDAGRGVAALPKIETADNIGIENRISLYREKADTGEDFWGSVPSSIYQNGEYVLPSE